MQNRTAVSDIWAIDRSLVTSSVRRRIDTQIADPTLPTTITKAASKQTYYTIRLLADPDRALDAYRAYAYFRWVDDQLDENLLEQAQRQAFLERQQAIIDGSRPYNVSAEECLLIALLHSDRNPESGLRLYIRNMMAVMAFDTDRRGRLISDAELTAYSHHLATAVTEALHYFIGHDDGAPQTQARYLAVTGAHITHMLRDAYEDTAAGYTNISREFLESYDLDPSALESDAYRAWVKGRVDLARRCFEAGRAYIRQVKNWRCRLAGYAYTARFEWVLDTIEREEYRLRPAYPERKGLKAALRMGWSACGMLVRSLV